MLCKVTHCAGTPLSSPTKRLHNCRQVLIPSTIIKADNFHMHLSHFDYMNCHIKLVLPWQQNKQLPTLKPHPQKNAQQPSRTQPNTKFMVAKVQLSYSLFISPMMHFSMLLTSLFACLAFNTGEDLYCAHVC